MSAILVSPCFIITIIVNLFLKCPPWFIGYQIEKKHDVQVLSIPLICLFHFLFTEASLSVEDHLTQNKKPQEKVTIFWRMSMFIVYLQIHSVWIFRKSVRRYAFGTHSRGKAFAWGGDNYRQDGIFKMCFLSLGSFSFSFKIDLKNQMWMNRNFSWVQTG